MRIRRIDREDRYAVFNITTDMANEILQMQKLVVDNGLSSVEKHAEEAMWYGEHPAQASGRDLERSEIEVYTPTIAVTTTDIFFVAIEEMSGLLIMTEPVSITKLVSDVLGETR